MGKALRRRLIVTLSAEEYRRLERIADREDRATDQQASHMLRRLLAEASATPPNSVE